MGHSGIFQEPAGLPTLVCAQREVDPYFGFTKTLFAPTVPGTIFGRMISAAETSLKANSAKRTEPALRTQTQVYDGKEGAISQGHHNTLEMVPMGPLSSVIGICTILAIKLAKHFFDVLFISTKTLITEI